MLPIFYRLLIVFSFYNFKKSTLKNSTTFSKVTIDEDKDSLDVTLHQVFKLANKENLFLSLSKTVDWLKQSPTTRLANHISIDYDYWTRFALSYPFDGAFFIDKTSNTKQIKD